MKTFDFKYLTLLMYVSYLCLLNVNCSEISQGDQRKKFEFLYKVSNHSSLIREISNELIYYKNLTFFENKITNLNDEIKRIEVIKNWEQSKVIKQDLIRILDEDIVSVYELTKLELAPDANIRNESEVQKINERIDKFSEELSKTIVQVGKEQ